MPLGAKNVVKRYLFFVPEDVLFSGKVNKSISREKTDLVMKFLKGLESMGLIELFLISGREKHKAIAEIAGAGLKKFFKKENIFLLNDSYLNSRAEPDRERYDANLAKDPFFTDDFFKQSVLTGLLSTGKIMRENAVLIGHDLWFDGFYTARYSGIDFVLLRDSFSERNVPSSQIPGWVHCTDFSREDFESLIAGKIPKTDAKVLESYIFKHLAREMVDAKELAVMMKKAQDKRTGLSEGEGTVVPMPKE